MASQSPPSLLQARRGDAALVSPEGQLLVAPKVVGYLNGVASLAFHGLSNWDGGLGSWTYNVVGAKSGDLDEVENVGWLVCGGCPNLSSRLQVYFK